MNPSIVIIYHSGYGHTKKVAEAVAEGSGGTLLAIDAEGNLPEGAWEQLAAARAIVFGSPTYMGGPSWQFKKFADASMYAGLFDADERAELALEPQRLAYVHLVRGEAQVNGQRLHAGDALKLEGEPRVSIEHGHGAELIVFDLGR